MEKLTCHKVLNVSVSDIVVDVKSIPRLPVGKSFFVTRIDPKVILKSIMYEKLSALGTLYCLLFEMKPNVDKGSIHIDIDSDTKLPFWPSFNIIIEGQGVMRWFSPSVPGKLRFNTYGKVFYKSWDSYYGPIIDEWRYGKIAIVRTDIPHQAYNFDDSNRLVASVRWSKRTSWEETLDFFKNYF